MLKEFLKENKERFIIWGIAIGVAAIFLIIATIVNLVKNPPEKQTIFVNAPNQMITAFNNTFEELKLDDDYVIEYTEDLSKANFSVSTNPKDNSGKQIAYSPIISVFNADESLYESLIKEKYLIEYEKESEYYDLDFNRIMNEIINNKGSKFKIYYPAKNTQLWEEFYSLLLITVNDGNYPKQGELKVCQEKIDKFLNAKNVEPIDITNLKQFNGFSKNSIYFMTYADLGYFFETNGGISCRVIYPKVTVYEGFYASYDEIGKIIYDSLYTETSSFLGVDTNQTGLYYLRIEHYNTEFYSDTYAISNGIFGDERAEFYGVQIPNSEILIYEEE